VCRNVVHWCLGRYFWEIEWQRCPRSSDCV